MNYNATHRQIIFQLHSVRIKPLLHDFQCGLGTLLRIGDNHSITGGCGACHAVAVGHLKTLHRRLFNNIILCTGVKVGNLPLPVVAVALCQGLGLNRVCPIYLVQFQRNAGALRQIGQRCRTAFGKPLLLDNQPLRLFHIGDRHAVSTGKTCMPFRTFRIGVGHIVAIRFFFLFHGVGVAVFQGVIILRGIRVDIRPVVIRREGDALRRPRRVLYAVFIASDFNRNGLMVDIRLLLTVCILPHLADGDLLGGIFNVHRWFCLVGCNKTDIRFRHFSIPYCRIRFFLGLVCIQHEEIVGRAVTDVAIRGLDFFELVEYACSNTHRIACYRSILSILKYQ